MTIFTPFEICFEYSLIDQSINGLAMGKKFLQFRVDIIIIFKYSVLKIVFDPSSI